jgi:NADH dehydrogenase FAD-containing subunit
MRGNAIEVDLILKAAGVEAEPTPLRTFLKARCDANGSIRVNRLLQVPSLLNTWAVGDCASTGEMHMIAVATMHAKLVAKNIIAYIKGLPLVEHKPAAVVGMTVPLGENDGVGYVGDRIRSGNEVVKLKAAQLGIEDWWKRLGYPEPVFGLVANEVCKRG